MKKPVSDKIPVALMGKGAKLGGSNVKLWKKQEALHRYIRKRGPMRFPKISVRPTPLQTPHSGENPTAREKFSSIYLPAYYKAPPLCIKSKMSIPICTIYDRMATKWKWNFARLLLLCLKQKMPQIPPMLPPTEINERSTISGIRRCCGWGAARLSIQKARAQSALAIPTQIRYIFKSILQTSPIIILPSNAPFVKLSDFRKIYCNRGKKCYTN